MPKSNASIEQTELIATNKNKNYMIFGYGKREDSVKPLVGS